MDGYLADDHGWNGRVIWNATGRRLLREWLERRAIREEREAYRQAALRELEEKLRQFREQKS